MIKVVNRRMPKYTVECSNCKSQLEFDECDIQYDSEEYNSRYHFYSFIDCPLCKKRVFLKIDELETSLIERIE